MWTGRGQCLLGSCVCEPGWIGDGCTAQACNPPCHPERGTCTIGDDGEASCKCADGWSDGWPGADCTELDCPRFEAAGGSAAVATQVGSNCAGHGVCTIKADDSRECVCEPGWSGAACEYPVCAAGAPLDGCSNQGECGCAPTANASVPLDGSPIRTCEGPHQQQVCYCSAVRAWDGSNAHAACSLCCR